ncbi:sensor histidine kinase [Williamsia sterculiae]|uniref:histidine kinase n=1 Tax=Williamsia sterculiae TaxID=1344003 RepID=A0A1N7GWK1_9NOCA|nr:histidine kinase [Williamsia sterculiae]SIS16942.1 Signal transduction histidine kinase [Williamsia sterculiae]
MRDPLHVPGLSRWGAVGDIALGAVIALLGSNLHPDVRAPVSMVVVGLMVGLSVCLRRIAPSAMLVLSVASAGIQVVTGDIAPFSSFCYVIVFYTLGRHPRRVVRRTGLILALVGTVVAGIRLQQSFLQTDPRGPTWQQIAIAFAVSAVVVVGGWSAGFIRHQRRVVQQARVSETIAEVERLRAIDLMSEQAERTQLARDVHDVVAHSLAVVIAQAEGARYALDADVHKARSALEVIAGTARDALGDVRAILLQLRPDQDSSTSVRSDRDQLIARMTSAGMSVVLIEDGAIDDAPTAVAGAATRILAEALTNALKYGDLSQPVEVTMRWMRECRLTVRNAVTESPLMSSGTGHGIGSMVAQAAALGGNLTSSATENRWCVEMIIPDAQGTGEGSRP